MSDAVQEAIAKARAGGKKASAKDAAPATPAPVVTAASALPAHEIDVVTKADPITSAAEEVKSDIIEAVEAASPARDTAKEAATDVVVTHVALVKDTTHGEVLGESFGHGNVENLRAFAGEVLTDRVKLEAPLEADGYATDSYGGYHWGTPEEIVTAPAGDVHPAFASLPPAGLDIPVFKG